MKKMSEIFKLPVKKVFESNGGFNFVIDSNLTNISQCDNPEYAEAIVHAVNSHDEMVELLKDSEKYSEHLKSCTLNSRSEIWPCDCGRSDWLERKTQLLAKMKEV